MGFNIPVFSPFIIDGWCFSQDHLTKNVSEKQTFLTNFHPHVKSSSRYNRYKNIEDMYNVKIKIINGVITIFIQSIPTSVTNTKLQNNDNHRLKY